MLFSVIHTTSYIYEGSVTYCHNTANLKPREFLGQKLVDYRLNISPKPNYIEEDLDFFGNTVTRFSINEPHKELIVTAISKVERNYDLEPNVFTSEICKNTTVKEALEIRKNLF